MSINDNEICFAHGWMRPYTVKDNMVRLLRRETFNEVREYYDLMQLANLFETYPYVTNITSLSVQKKEKNDSVISFTIRMNTLTQTFLKSYRKYDTDNIDFEMEFTKHQEQDYKLYTFGYNMSMLTKQEICNTLVKEYYNFDDFMISLEDKLKYLFTDLKWR